MTDHKPPDCAWKNLANGIMDVLRLNLSERSDSRALQRLNSALQGIKLRGGTLPGIDKPIFVPDREIESEKPEPAAWTADDYFRLAGEIQHSEPEGLTKIRERLTAVEGGLVENANFEVDACRRLGSLEKQTQSESVTMRRLDVLEARVLRQGHTIQNLENQFAALRVIMQSDDE